jgi:type VI secretion system FHA domain protein
LTLDIISAPSGMPAQRQRSFREDGGRIGRDKSSDWVLPHNKVSSRHAVISYRNGVFHIEDRSRNGVFLNSTTNRLAPGKPQPLQSGDVIFIEPYEIQVSVAEDVGDSALRFDQDDDPFAQRPVPGILMIEPPLARAEQVEGQDLAEGEVDPLKLLGGSGGAPMPQGRAPQPRDIPELERIEREPMRGHYQPPAIVEPSPPLVSAPEASADPGFIPADYDPLKDSSVVDFAEVAPPKPVPRREPPAAPRAELSDSARPNAFKPPMPDPFAAPVQAAPPLPAPDPFEGPSLDPFGPAAADPFAAPRPASHESQRVAKPTPKGAPAAPAAVPPVAAPRAPEVVKERQPVPAPPPPEAPAIVVPAEARAESRPVIAPPPPPSGAGSDLAAVLAGAGLTNVPVTPELAENFGRILGVVVAGVMDLLRARQQVKDELRMRQTQFRPVDNNPLKFSANVEDALHNLLVKRNPAYLKPVDAFADAFDDLRDHQLAMLAGLRVAFEAMLAEFDPARLEEQFDRQLKKGALLSVPAKLRYWEAYRERTRHMLADMDATFRKWFGEEFVKAYEEQLERLEVERGERKP